MILAGDNYIDSDISPLVTESKAHHNSVIIATRRIANRSDARNRFGVVEVNNSQQPSNPVIGYEEKPDAPRTSEISLGMYVFPFDFINMQINGYIKEINNLVDQSEKQKKLGAQGYFLEWLVKENNLVRAVRFDQGIWIDVGTPSSYMSSIIQATRELIERPTCARDLDVLGGTMNLSDRYHFVCKRAKIIRQNGVNTISLYFQGDDPIATQSYQAANGTNILSINHIRTANNQIKTANVKNNNTLIASCFSYVQVP
jgi:dTDP-glucose pyrophosphorylase